MKQTKNQLKENEKGTSLSLWTDLYQLTTAAAYFVNRVNVRATFELYVRRLPPAGKYLIAAGLQQVVDYLRNLSFTHDDIEYLKHLPDFSNIPDEFFAYLKEMRFSGDVWALPEGTPFFEGEPVIRISAPIIEAQIVESYILSVTNYQITVASKAARIVEAAKGKKVVDFGFRRAPSPEAAHYATRAAYIAGVDATSNLEGGRRYDIPVISTIPYSFVLAFKTEKDALTQYAKAFPDGALVLIDAVNQEAASREVIACGEKLRGVKLSARNLLKLSRSVREILDGARQEETKIIASGDLDEKKIEKLVESSAPIDFFGVGANLVTPTDSTMAEGIYKLVEIEEKRKIRYPEKFLAGKETVPGKKQIIRKLDKNGRYAGDLIAKAGEIPRENEEVCLRKVMEEGKLVAPLPRLKDIRRYCLQEMIKLPPGVKKISGARTYPVKVSSKLKELCRRQEKEEGGP
ncbi:MAG: nicotinate phosphoribosyltransferase [Pseudomonadota bacterium]